jgi:threonine dehydratase
MPEITPDLIREAAIRIRPLAKRTPVLTSDVLDERVGAKVYLKCENLQRGGAFKIRGAANLILSLTPEQVERGVVAFSSGNHAQAVAIAAKYVGARATIVMPSDAPRSKMEPTRALGARVVTYDRMKEDRERISAEIMAETGGTLAPPFDHPMIAAGQGTAALELMEEVGELDAIITPAGGGGLLSGSAVIARSINPRIRVFGVEPENGGDIAQSMAKGERVAIPVPETIADGLRTSAPGKVTFPVIQQMVEKIALVSDDEIRTAVRFLLEHLRILVEPSGAVGVAALLSGKIPAPNGRIGVVLSGGNVDLDFLKTL